MTERDKQFDIGVSKDRATVEDGRVIRIRPPDAFETMTETCRLRELSELRLPRGRSDRLLDFTPQVCREALDAFAWGLEPNSGIEVQFGFDKAGRFSLRTRCSATAPLRHDSEQAALGLQNGFQAALAAAGLHLWFKEASASDSDSIPPAWQMEILPPGLLLDSLNACRSRVPSPRLHYDRQSKRDGGGIVIAPPRSTPFSSLDALLRGLAVAGVCARLTISLRSRLILADELRLLAPLAQKSWENLLLARTDALPLVNAYEIAQPLCALLRSFEREGKAIEISASIEAAAPLPNATLRLAAAVVWGTHHFSKENSIHERDWRRLLPLGYQLPHWLPSQGTMESMGVPIRLAPRRREPCNGLLLGYTADGDEVRLSEAARERSTYCCGATGSGKSTMLANMVLQDIAANRGLILIDPHGDITLDVLARVPPKATRRVVALDLADPDFAPGLNAFDVRGTDAELVKPLICGELLRIFKYELFADIPEAFGPMFEMYYRNAIMLLLEAEGPSSATMVDVPRVFQDDKYRKLLIDCCPNRHVRAFWLKTADRVSHDEIELPNVAPYVIAKFEPFLGSRGIRTIVGQPETTLDFGSFMDEGRAVLISLAKGALGSNEARVLGLLLLQQIQIACMARARRPREERRPVTLYVDEAQSFIGGVLTELLAEARKFGLSLVLANQTMAQLSGRTSRTLIDVLLGNVANLLALRVGVRDAELLAPWFRPHMTVDDLVGLPDFCAAARILENGRPGAPVLIDLPPLPPPGDSSIAKTITASSRAIYCRARSDVEAKLQA